MMKKMVKSGLSILLTGILLGQTTGTTNVFSVFAEDTCTLWSAPFTEKIKREDEYDISEYGGASVNVDAARAECEAVQLVITANQKVEYRVKVSDLSLVGDSGVKFSAENVDVYSALYTNVSGLYNGKTRHMTTGWYPDAMLPYSAAVEYGENQISEKENQSVYFDFNIPWDQTAGVYTGQFTLTVGGQEYKVPVTLQVRDLTVETDLSTKSAFLDDWTHYLGEYEGSQRMQDLYHQALMNYRLVPSKLVTDTKYTQEDAEYYAEKVVELYKYGSDEEKFGKGADRFTNFVVPVSLSNEDNFCKQFNLYLHEFAKVSCRENVNFIERTTVYCVDEPEMYNASWWVEIVDGWYKAGKLSAAAYLEQHRAYYKSEYGATDEFIDELIESVGNIHNVITQGYMEKYEGIVETWCPTYDSYDYPANVEKYNETNPDEKWWYGCVVPVAPYPTYHVDDLGFSPRIVGWLQAVYGVKGNLYWAVDSYAAYKNAGNQGYAYRYQEDYYDAAANYDICSGEGYLFRPGKKYGIDGPIPTTRITSIRDGLEEYELLEDLKEVYAATEGQIGVPCDAVSTISDLISSMCTGMQVSGTSADFYKARKDMLDLCEFTSTGAVFSSFADDGSGHISYDLFVPDGASVQATGAKLDETLNVNGGKIYKYSVDMTVMQADSVLFTVVKDGKTFSIERALPGSVSAHNVTSATLGEMTGDLNTDAALTEIDGNQVVRLSLKEIGAEETRRYQRVYFTPSYLNEINADVSKLLLKFYFLPANAQETLKVRICIKYKNKLSVEEVFSGSLVNGYNEIAIVGNRFSWTNGEIERIDFRFDDAATGVTVSARKDIYFAGVTVYGS